MNNFELFTMMYFVFDAIYDELPEEKKNIPEDKWQDDLGMYLSEICPFTWKSCDSADPAYFIEFSEFMRGKQIGDDYGYSLVCEYLEKENYYHNVLETFRTYKREDWIDACKRYISEPHKGDSVWQAEYEKKKRDEKNRKQRERRKKVD